MMKYLFSICLLLIGLVTVGIPALAADRQLAFPGAAGFGKFAQGGRLGKIIPVTTLADSGIGSLRACIEAEGPRNCIFRVGGTIKLLSPLGIEGARGNVSLLGQTAPDPGITLTIGNSNPSHIKTPLYVRNTKNVIIRHLRFRLQYDATVENADALTVENSNQIYIDHVSGAWATDEVFSTHLDTTDITIANSLFAQGLKPHSKCALLGSDPKAPQNVSFWRNACISNNDRNPDVNHFGGSCVEVVNNLFYNARSEWTEVFSQYSGGTPVSIVGNYFKAGPDTLPLTSILKWQPDGSVAPPKVFSKDNVVWAPEGKEIGQISPDISEFMSTQPACPLVVPVDDANESYKTVRSQVGAFPRDKIDRKLVKDVGDRGEEGRGSILSEHGKVNDEATDALPYVDEDGDGVADSFEEELGTQVGQFDPWVQSASTSWYAFDDFMEWLSRERIDGRYPS